MKFSIDKNILLENLVNVTRAISTKNVIPILNGIKMELTEEGLYLTASDSELTIKSFIETKEIKHVDTLGSIIIQSKFILDIIRKLPGEVVNFEIVDGLKIRIYTDNSEYNLNCLNPIEYPQIRLEEVKEPFIIKSAIFKKIINQTVFAISTQELRPLLTGLNLKITGDILECISTDSYRLAKKIVKLDKASNDEINIVIPGKNIQELDKILDDEEDLEMHIFNNKVVFKYKNITFQSNLLAGTYPNTNNLIPTEFSYMINVNIHKFYDAIDRAALLTQSKDKNIVKMNVNNKEMTITSFASEVGKVEEKLEIESNNSTNLDISFSARYMMEALRTFKDEQILILLNGEVKPIVIKSVDDESLIQLILPIKTY